MSTEVLSDPCYRDSQLPDPNGPLLEPFLGATSVNVSLESNRTLREEYCETER